MKNTIKMMVAGGFLAASLVMVSSCQKDMSNAENLQYASVISVSGDGTTSVIEANVQSAFIETPELTETELASLLKMKEEERLARDVYSSLNQTWNNQVFARICVAENNHLNAIVRLLTYYGSADTLIGEAGIFANTDVQALYTNLVEKGSVSIEEAYKTGAMIEEMDIEDLKVAIAATSNANITMVFENLEKGSRNHLRSFYNQLTALGVLYTPVFITQDEYDQIVTSAMEKGKQYRMNDQKGKGKGNKGQGNQGGGNCQM